MTVSDQTPDVLPETHEFVRFGSLGATKFFILSAKSESYLSLDAINHVNQRASIFIVVFVVIQSLRLLFSSKSLASYSLKFVLPFQSLSTCIPDYFCLLKCYFLPNNESLCLDRD
jgi:hypothetical protein